MMSMFCGDSGKVSMMRVSTFMTTVAILGVFLAHNVVAVLHGTGFVSMGYEECALLAATIGLKAFQTKYENSGAAPAEPPADAAPVLDASKKE
jgi:hypothetical protein